MDLRAIQKPLKEKYRSDPNSSRITLRATGDQTDTPISCSIEVGEKILEAQAHSGAGTTDTAVCLCFEYLLSDFNRTRDWRVSLIATSS